MPQAFAIISAWATTGERWPEAENRRADAALQALLLERGVWHRRLTGYSPRSGHAEPGWAAELDFETACTVGMAFLQDAIYYVRQGRLSVSYCDARRAEVPVADFAARLDPP